MAERKEFRLSIISIWLGILIPILAAIIPFALSKLSPEHNLEFSLVGPISAKDVQAAEIAIVNNGGKVEKGVRIWVQAFPVFELLESLRPKGEKKKSPVDLLLVESKSAVTVTKEGEYYIIAVGDIRPKEQVSVSIVAREVKLAIHRFSDRASGIEVKSDEHVATFTGQSFLEEFLYPFGFWMFIILMVLLLIISLYQDFFMSSKMREKLILKEIDKLKD